MRRNGEIDGEKDSWKERVRDGKSGGWPYDHRGSRQSREQKNKKCFSPVESPLKPHLFLLRKREESWRE